jgi:hypothetical protein
MRSRCSACRSACWSAAAAPASVSVVGSVTNLGCVLRAEGMPEDRYIATIRKSGSISASPRNRRWPGACSHR